MLDGGWGRICGCELDASAGVCMQDHIILLIITIKTVLPGSALHYLVSAKKYDRLMKRQKEAYGEGG